MNGGLLTTTGTVNVGGGTNRDPAGDGESYPRFRPPVTMNGSGGLWSTKRRQRDRDASAVTDNGNNGIRINAGGSCRHSCVISGNGGRAARSTRSRRRQFLAHDCNIMNNANVGVIGNGRLRDMNNCYLYQNAGRPGFDTNTMASDVRSTDSQYQGMTSVLAPRTTPN